MSLFLYSPPGPTSMCSYFRRGFCRALVLWIRVPSADTRVINSPLGLFGPGFKETGQFAGDMIRGLNEKAEENGCKFAIR